MLDGAGRLVAAMLLVRSKATGMRAPFFYAPRGPVCADPHSPALPILIDFARREARRAGGFFIRAEPNIVQDDSVWPGVFKRLGFHPTDHHIYLRSAWVTDLRPSEDDASRKHDDDLAAEHPRGRAQGADGAGRVG